jgi:hypothetical protein
MSLFKYYSIMAYREVDVEIHAFLNSALNLGERSALHYDRSVPWESDVVIHGWAPESVGINDTSRYGILGRYP